MVMSDRWRMSPGLRRVSAALAIAVLAVGAVKVAGDHTTSGSGFSTVQTAAADPTGPTGGPGGDGGNGSQFQPPSLPPQQPDYRGGTNQPPLDQNSGISIYNTGSPGAQQGPAQQGGQQLEQGQQPVHGTQIPDYQTAAPYTEGPGRQNPDYQAPQQQSPQQQPQQTVQPTQTQQPTQTPTQTQQPTQSPTQEPSSSQQQPSPCPTPKQTGPPTAAPASPTQTPPVPPRGSGDDTAPKVLDRKDVADLIAKSPQLQKQVRQLGANDWKFVFRTDGYAGTETDYTPRVIRLDPKEAQTGAANIVQSIAHEVGHAEYGPNHYDLSSREAYIWSGLLNESAATVNNIQVRAEILAATGGQVDIGVAGAGGAQYIADYAKFGDSQQTRDLIAKNFGEAEAPSNDPSAKNYAETLGNWYDKYIKPPVEATKPPTSGGKESPC